MTSASSRCDPFASITEDEVRGPPVIRAVAVGQISGGQSTLAGNGSTAGLTRTRLGGVWRRFPTEIRTSAAAIEDRLHNDGRFTDSDATINTASRRKAEALVEAMHRASGTDPERTAIHPDVIVNVPLDALISGEPDPFDPPTVIGGGPITMGDLYRFAMLGTVSAMTTRPTDGRPLSLGRKVRLATADQWIAATIWHRGCVVPGCDRPAAWCHAHHHTYWRNSGTTDLANLPFVCTHHHHLIHDQGWTITPQPDGTWHLHRPDGTTIPQPRYPGHHKPRARSPS